MGFSINHVGSGGTATPATVYTSGAFAIAENDTLVYFVGHNLGTISSITWNSLSLTKIIEKVHATANLQGSIWVLEDVSAATSSIVVTFSASNNRFSNSAWIVTPTKPNLTADQFSSNEGTSTAGDTGTTGTLTYPGELAIGMLIYQSSGGLIVWDSPFTAVGQGISGGSDSINLGNAYLLNEYETTGIIGSASRENVAWVGMIITLQEGAPEVQITSVVQSQEYQRGYVAVTTLVQQQEYTRARVEMANVVQIIEYKIPSDIDFIGAFV